MTALLPSLVDVLDTTFSKKQFEAKALGVA
jgi:hypothetical protein